MGKECCFAKNYDVKMDVCVLNCSCVNISASGFHIDEVASQRCLVWNCLVSMCKGSPTCRTT